MPSRVLLISVNACDEPYPVFPLGLAQVNAALRENGHDTRWIDCLADGFAVERTIAEFRPDVIGFSLRNIDDVAFHKRETYFGSLITLCRRIRGIHSCSLVVGGSGYSVFPEQLLERSGADFGIHGEGERPLVDLLEALETNADYQDIPGLVFRENGSIRLNPQQPTGIDQPLESEDRPARLVDFYLEQSRMLNVQTQRGCSFKCCYCTYPLIEGRHHRRRPPEVIADEFQQLEEQGARYVFIVDSVFNSSRQHVLETCAAIRRRDLKLKWGCFLRPQGLDPEQVDAMASAGLSNVEFGSDSFSDRVLAAYGKQLRFEEILRSHELTVAAKIEVCHFLILGGLGETKETLEETLENSRQLDGSVILPIVGMRVYPGTALHDQALREKRITEETDLLEPCHYIADGLSPAYIDNRLQEWVKTHPNWITGEPPPIWYEIVKRLRKRGKLGPLWTYFAALQKWPGSMPEKR